MKFPSIADRLKALQRHAGLQRIHRLYLHEIDPVHLGFQGMEPMSLALAGGFFTTESPRKPPGKGWRRKLNGVPVAHRG